MKLELYYVCIASMACDKAALPSGGIQEGCSPLKNLMFKTLWDIILTILESISVNFFYSQSMMSESEKKYVFSVFDCNSQTSQ